MKLINILQAREAIKNHLQDKISYKAAYKFACFMKATETQRSFYDEQIKALVELCGKRNDKGEFMYERNSVVLDKEHISDWTAKTKELNETEVDTPTIVFIPEDFDEIKVSTEEMIALSEFIKEGYITIFFRVFIRQTLISLINYFKCHNYSEIFSPFSGVQIHLASKLSFSFCSSADNPLNSIAKGLKFAFVIASSKELRTKQSMPL